jgi:HD-GYP domain-containing protein (c-di-GMP phosphodiesterase class II)
LTQTLLSVFLPLAVYAYLRFHRTFDLQLVMPRGHFQVVTIASMLAAAAAVAVGIAGARLRNMQVIFLSVAFTSLAVLFSLHGLATPGFLLPMTPVPGVAAQVAILVTAFWLWMSSQPADQRLVSRLARWGPWLTPAWAALLAVLVLLLMRFPALVAFVPMEVAPLKWIAVGITLALSLAAGRHYWMAYRYSQLPLQAAVVCSIGLLGAAQIIEAVGEVWRLSWWTYHFLFLLAMVLMLWGLRRQYATGTSLSTAVKTLFGLNPGERIEAGISPSMRALVIATEARDRYTAGHSFRAAVFALRLGEAMGLPPEQLRALAQGGLLHDVGKIEIPDQILNKPGRLTPAERQLIERHPVIGFDMCKRLGLMQSELAVIRHHHEKWDGTGYPDRLKGEQIPLLARIMAVADVYDALTSTRAYRTAWTHAQAMSLLQEQAGTHFDPECVAACVQMSPEWYLVQTYPSWLSPTHSLSESGDASALRHNV